MKPRLVLLLTQDPGLQVSLSQALASGDPTILLAHNADEALQIACARGRELDFAVIDFGDGCRGMTLLGAIEICQPALPVIAITSGDAYHAAAIAYANGVEACLARPIRADDLEIVIHELAKLKLQLEAA